MIQTSAHLNAQLQELRVAPEFDRRLRVLIEHCRRNLPSVDEDRIRRAFRTAYWAHRHDKRASGEPYITHPLEVALIAAKAIRLDDVTVAVCLLHDTVEDTDISLELIESEFGEEIARITDGVTKIGHVFENRALSRAENVRKLMLSMASDVRVILVKFADRLHNMQTLDGLPPAKRLKVASETRDLYAPLAHRFGLHEVKTKLEDLALKHLEPEVYDAIASGLNSKRRQRERFIDRFIQPVRKELEDVGLEFSIYGRPKSIYSIWRKMQHQGKELDEIYDLFAIRVILESEGKQGKEDCWRVYSILTDLYSPIPERFRDFISTPKSNGYQSLHTTVIGSDGTPVEIQIRTAEMHEIAERGVAAHWLYKETGGDGAATQRGEKIEKMYDWVRDLIENPRPDDAGEFVREFELNLYDEEIHVFTPKGDLMTLPNGATPVDFAFKIHTEVGFHCIGAKVNGKMAPLSKRLEPGDQVEILTSKKQTPNPDWVEFVATHKARSRIRHWINERRRKTIEAGKDLLNKRLAKAKLEPDNQQVTRVANKLKFPSTRQLYYEIGAGLYNANDFVKVLKRGGRPPDAEEDVEQEFTSAEEGPARIEPRPLYDDAKDGTRPALLIDGERHTDLAVEYAQCCNPIPGDKVFGFVSKTGVVKIHRANCRNASDLLLNQSDRILDVEWSRQKNVQFPVALRVVGEDRVGMVSDLSTVISKNLKTNIRSITIEGEDGMFEGRLVLFVSDIGQLRRITKRLARVDGVYGVYRADE